MKYKTKYKLLSKDEKKKLKNKFYQTEYGKVAKGRLDRLVIYGVVGYIVSIYMLITDKSTTNIVIAFILLLASTIYLVASFKLRFKELNNFLIKK